MHYLDGIKTIPPTNADNALILGTALHTGIETNAENAIKEYCNAFPIIDDLHINEIVKLEYLIPRVKELLPKGQHEVQVVNSDFIAFLDLLTPNDDGTFDLYDFKYSNNIDNYMKSGQLHEYKYFFEKQSGKIIKNLFFVFIPKVQIKQKKTEDLRTFRNRIMDELKKSEIKIVPVEFNIDKVIDFTLGMKRILENKDFEKNQSYLCNWCEYQEYCEKGWDYMLLPKNERRIVGEIEKKVLWIYGSPFSGKTTLANQFDAPLMLNTDGNIKFVDAPYVPIKDIVTVEGRITKKTLAWAILKDTIGELEKKQNDFKTIIVDLLEDCYEHCRLFMYDQMGITHESDDSFKAWDKVRGEFLNTLKRLINLDYENIILISHEDTSKDITKKGGDKITSIKPNLADKVATKVAGMVDIVARVIADDTVRTLNFKTNEVIFGGGRLTVKTNTIPLSYEELMNVYAEANSGVNKGNAAPASTEASGKKSRKKAETEPIQTATTSPEGSSEDANVETRAEGASVNGVQVSENEPTRTSRKRSSASTEETTAPETTTEAAPTTTEPAATGSTTRTRKKRGE